MFAPDDAASRKRIADACDVNGSILDANEVFLKMVGYDRQELLQGRLRWKDLTPGDQLGITERAIAELKKKDPRLEDFTYEIDGHKLKLINELPEAESHPYTHIRALT